MGRGDNRRTKKMLKRRAWRRNKARVRKKLENKKA